MRIAVALFLCGMSLARAEPHSYGAVDDARLRNVGAEPTQWLAAGRDRAGTYYSPLAGINDKNVGTLGFAWEYLTGTFRGLEATPLVVDGTMYTSGNWGVVYALNAATGKLLWSYDPRSDGQVARYTCCDVVNRGVAVWRGRVYVASLDGRLIALKAADGAVVWSVDTLIDHQQPPSAMLKGPSRSGGWPLIRHMTVKGSSRRMASCPRSRVRGMSLTMFCVPGIR